MRQFMLTSAAGKRLIGKALSVRSAIKKSLASGTLVIVAGTTNGYVAEEILTAIGQVADFSRAKFFRGISLPPSFKSTDSGRLPDESGFPGDVIIRDGVWQKGKTVYDVADSLREGDVVLKGANALDLVHKRAAVLVGHQQGGTIVVALQAVVGRRIRLILPVGLEKRISGDLDELVTELNAPGVKGLRLLPVPGEVFTEIDALSLLAGVNAELFAAGGVNGAEGSVWLVVNGAPEKELEAIRILQSVASEPAFTI